MSAQPNSNSKHIFDQVKFLGDPPDLDPEERKEFFACLERVWVFFDPQDEIERILVHEFVEETFYTVPIRQIVREHVRSLVELSSTDVEEDPEDIGPLAFLIEDEKN